MGGARSPGARVCVHLFPADERDLPQVGVDIERERRLSSLRILSAEYGTRCSTVVRITSAGTIDFAERSYRADGDIAGEVRYRLDMMRQHPPIDPGTV